VLQCLSLLRNYGIVFARAKRSRIVNSKAEILRGLGAEFTYDGVVPHSESATSGGFFSFDDEDYLHYDAEPPGELRDKVTSAAAACPVRAISIAR